MANTNRNRGRYASRQNWEDTGYNREPDYNKGYYGQEYGDMDYGREEYNRRYGYGSADRNINFNQDYDDYNSGRRYQRNLGNQANRNWGRQDYGNYGGFQGSQYGSDYERRRMGLSNEYPDYGGSYSTDYGRHRSWREDEGDYGKYGVQRRNKQQESIYGGDTSNYGNANQGAFDRDWWDRTRDEVSSWFGDEDAQRRRRWDKTIGKYKGVGPKGYRRSDERIREDVNDRLSYDDMVDASDIEVTVNNCEVTLTGTVDSRQAKRRAEDIVEDVLGVENVSNQLRVNREHDSGDRGLTLPGTERRRDK